MEPGRVVVAPWEEHHRDDLARVAGEGDAGRVEGPEPSLEAPAPREVMCERQAREGRYVRHVNVTVRPRMSVTGTTNGTMR